MVKRKHNVLIADDNEADRYFLREIIEHHAPQLAVVGEAGGGDEVIAYLWGYGEYADREKHPMPELLIMDIGMPRMTGTQVLEWMQTQRLPPLKVVMLADTSTQLFRHRVGELGFRHFYSKDMETNELVDLVKRLEAELETGRVEARAGAAVV